MKGASVFQILLAGPGFLRFDFLHNGSELGVDVGNLGSLFAGAQILAVLNAHLGAVELNLTQGQELAVDQAEVKEGVTKPPAHYTEASLLAAMEQAGRDEQPKETQRRGIGTAATRAGILERLVSQGFVQRVKGKDGQAATLIPAQSGSALAAILPEPLRSPQLTAQWEWSLQKIEDGLLEPEAFLAEVQEMVTGLVSGFTPVEDAEYLFPSNRPVVGTCPRCGREVTESPKGFFCENPRCRFALWRDNRFFTNKQFSLTKEKAQALLQRGEVFEGESPGFASARGGLC